MLQSKCLRLVPGAFLYLSNRQIHDDLGVPLFADHIRTLTASFDSTFADVGNPLVGHADQGLTPPPDAKAKSGGDQQASRGHRLTMAKSALISRALFGCPD
jgi:hypothetical protein